jgi:hypothetical protein
MFPHINNIIFVLFTMELIPIHEMKMHVKISSHERHVTYICVSKRGLCLGHGFFTKENASHKCPKFPYYQ